MPDKVFIPNRKVTKFHPLETWPWSPIPRYDTATPHEDEKEVQQPEIYLNEDLAKRRATLLWETRKLVRAKKLKGSWSFDGRILIENRYGRIRTVNSCKDIQQKIADWYSILFAVIM